VEELSDRSNTLFNLAQQYLGDGNRWHEITHRDGSPLTEAQAADLQVGQEVCIPVDKHCSEAHPR